MLRPTPPYFAPFILSLILISTGCATRSPRESLDRVQEGMDKARVLEAAGNPKRTYHQHGQDHWVYVFFEGERELVRQIDFANGVVAKVNPVTAKTNFNVRLENAESMEDFEKTVKQHQQKGSGFRDVPDDGKL